MTRDEFKQLLKDELTISCALPFQLPERELDRLIDLGKKWFRRNYEDAVELSAFVITHEDIQKMASFKSASRHIKLPKCVVSVVEVKEIKGQNRFSMVDKDFSLEKSLTKELYLSSFSSDNLVMMIAQESYLDLSKAFFLETIAYKFNENSGKLKILGRDPAYDVYINTYIDILEDELFEDWYFNRYIVSQAKISMGRMLGMFEYNLPGGVSINTDMLTTEGTEELQQIKEDIQEMQTPTFIEVWH